VDAADQVTCLLDDELIRVRVAGLKAVSKIFAARKTRGGKGKKKRFGNSEGSVAVTVVSMLSDEDADVRLAAINALAELGSVASDQASTEISNILEEAAVLSDSSGIKRATERRSMMDAP